MAIKFVSERPCVGDPDRTVFITSVGASPTATSFYLRTKGALEERLKAMAWERL